MDKLVDIVLDYNPGVGEILAGDLHNFVHFLLDTGRWTGTDDGHQDLHDAVTLIYPEEHLDHIMTPTDDVRIASPDLSEDQAGAQAEELPLWALTQLEQTTGMTACCPEISGTAPCKYSP